MNESFDPKKPVFSREDYFKSLEDAGRTPKFIAEERARLEKSDAEHRARREEVRKAAENENIPNKLFEEKMEVARQVKLISDGIRRQIEAREEGVNIENPNVVRFSSSKETQDALRAEGERLRNLEDEQGNAA